MEKHGGEAFMTAGERPESFRVNGNSLLPCGSLLARLVWQSSRMILEAGQRRDGMHIPEP